MGRKVFVVGVGMTKFEKPGAKGWDYPDMAKEAGEKALADAGIPYDAIEQAAVGYCYGDSTCGQRAVYKLGLTGIPVYNVNNNCSTGSTALFMAKQFVEGGIADCVLALGFEKMEKGSLGAKFTDRTNPLDKQFQAMVDLRGFAAAPPAPQFFGNAGREHMERYGTTAEQFAKIGQKNHRHSVNNPYSQFQDEYTLEQILGRADGLRAADQAPVLPDLRRRRRRRSSASEDFVKKHGLQGQAVEIAGMAMATDMTSTFDEKSCIKLVGQDLTRKAAPRRSTSSRASAPRTCRSSSCTTASRTNELITYEGLGLCARGQGRRAHRLGRRHLRRQVGREPVGRPHLQGPPARRHGPRPVRRAQLAAPRQGREAPGAGRQGGPPAQPRPRRRRRRDALPPGRHRRLMRFFVDRAAAEKSAHPSMRSVMLRATEGSGCRRLAREAP